MNKIIFLVLSLASLTANSNELTWDNTKNKDFWRGFNWGSLDKSPWNQALFKPNEAESDGSRIYESNNEFGFAIEVKSEPENPAGSYVKYLKLLPQEATCKDALSDISHEARENFNDYSYASSKSRFESVTAHEIIGNTLYVASCNKVGLMQALLEVKLSYSKLSQAPIAPVKIQCEYGFYREKNREKISTPAQRLTLIIQDQTNTVLDLATRRLYGLIKNKSDDSFDIELLSKKISYNINRASGDIFSSKLKTEDGVEFYMAGNCHKINKNKF